MKFINKKVLAVAVLGALASGNALADAEIQTTNTVYAKEIALPAALTLPVAWKLGYNFNTNETRYACVRLSGAALPPTIASPTITGSGDLTAGVVNVVGNNVAFFTISSDPTATIGGTSTDIVTMPALSITASDYNTTVTASVGLYDNPAAAGACNADKPAAQDPQRIPGSGDSKPLISFKQAYTLKIDSHKAVSTVSVDPSYTTFAAGSGLNAFPGGLGPVTLASNATLALVPGGILKADGTPIALADIFPTTATLKIAGNFNSDWLDSAVFTGAALTAAADEESVTSAAFNPLTVLTAPNAFTVEANGDGEIPAGIYQASMRVTPNTGYTLNYVVGTGSGAAVDLVPAIDETLITADTAVTDNAANAGQIDQDGVKLMTPLVQLAGGNWLARLAISNTGTKDRTFTLRAQGFDSEGDSSTVTVNGTNSFVVKAGTTYVFDNLANTLTFNGRARGTVTAIVNAPAEDIKGVYQLVNTAANTISNINMINPSNAAAGGH